LLDSLLQEINLTFTHKMADTLTLKEVELDYEADEAEEHMETSTPRDDTQNPTTPTRRREVETPCKGRQEQDLADGELPSSPLPEMSTDLISSPAAEGELDGNGEEKVEGELESGEELEDGEISDEDETIKNERLEPKPVCRFFSKGQCTWGQSCRFLHPGVLDKGNYSMFAAPRPILPGEPEDVEPVRKEEQVMIAPPVPAYESAWERGLRQAKEMRRRSSKRREMDVEYEEKKTSQSLTQVELDKENDYYMRPASPAHTHDPYADDDGYSDPYDTFHPEVRRVAPPPPPEFLAREERERSRYNESPPPRVRRIAPPRSPSPRGDIPHPPIPPGPGSGPGLVPQVSRNSGDQSAGRFRGGEDWADPWMRGGPEKQKMGRVDRFGGRRRSYSSGSSRSSSGSSRSRSPQRRKRYTSSYSSRSSSRSRSRSSTPAGIPRRGGPGTAGRGDRAHVKREPGSSGRNTAPLQKRLAVVSQSKVPRGQRNPSKDEKQSRKRRDSSSEDGTKSGSGCKLKSGKIKSGSDITKKDINQGAGGVPKGSKEHKPERSGLSKPKEPFKMSLPKNQIKLTLKTAHSAKPANQTVLEKLGMTNDDLAEAKKDMKRKAETEHTEAAKQQKIANLELMETLKRKLKSKFDASSKVVEKADKAGEEVAAAGDGLVETGDGKKVKGKFVAGGGDAKSRREELLKQLKAVEDAIHRKRTKLEK